MTVGRNEEYEEYWTDEQVLEYLGKPLSLRQWCSRHKVKPQTMVRAADVIAAKEADDAKRADPSLKGPKPRHLVKGRRGGADSPRSDTA